MKQIYTPEELNFENITEDEINPLREKFEALKSLAVKGNRLASHEETFFCMCVLVSRLNDGSLYDYPCCDDFLFKRNYLTYCMSLSGGIPYFKPQRIVDGLPQMVQVSMQEAQQDRNYLKRKAREWELVVKKENHTDQLLYQAAVEGRYALKQIDNLPEIKFHPYIKGSRYYEYKRRSALLQSKYVYLMVQDILRNTPPADFLLQLDGRPIEVNDYSLIHILNRHFAQAIKTYDSDKTFHGTDILYRKLPTQLKEIFQTFNASGIWAGRDITKIPFTINGVPNMIFTGPMKKTIKGQKMPVSYTRLHTFFPIGDSDMLKNLQDNYNLVPINEQYSVYTPK